MNRKKRKLIYIRTKNALHRGGVIGTIFKATSEINTEYIEGQLSLIMTKLSKKYKMPIEMQGIKTGTDGDDFARNLISVMATFKKAA